MGIAGLFYRVLKGACVVELRLLDLGLGFRV